MVGRRQAREMLIFSVYSALNNQPLVYVCAEVDWLQSLKQFFINVSYHILVASLTLVARF